MKRLICDENGVYVVDENCIKKKEQQEREKEMRWQKQRTFDVKKKRKKPL